MAKFMIIIHSFLIFLIPTIECNENITKCSTETCLNGICAFDNDKSMIEKCFCHNGYTGNDCSINFNECLPGRNPCLNDALCINDVPEARCICPDGFCGKYCEIDLDDCESNPCHNGATCIDRVNGFECICPLGYEGINCEIDIDACVIDIIDNNLKLHLSSNDLRCQHGGTCKDGPGLDYYCICNQGYNGTNCENEINICDVGPCKNNGKCRRINHREFKCLCPYGWTGRICEEKLYKCLDYEKENNPCKNNAICMFKYSPDDSNQFECFCPPDYYGEHCQYQFDECRPNNCQNGATCIDQLNGYHCKCPPGFNGKYCEIDCLKDQESCSIYIDDNLNNYTAIIESSITQTPIMTIITPSASIIPTIQTIAPTIEPLPPLTSITPTETSKIIIIKPTVPSKAIPLMIPKNIDLDNLNEIYAPNFNGIDSEVVFKIHRRIKRSMNSIEFDFVQQSHDDYEDDDDHSDDNDDNTGPKVAIMNAYTNKFNLLVFIDNDQHVNVELYDHNNSKLMNLKSQILIEKLKLYQLKLNVIELKKFLANSAAQKSLKIELILIQNNEQIDSVNVINENRTIPCFEWYRFGAINNQRLQQQSMSKLKTFNGCIFNIRLNQEKFFIKNSYYANNITECLSNVCDHNPCENNGICQLVSFNSIDYQKRLWNCSCTPGYRGWLCEEIYCHSDYCFNGGLCLLGEQIDSNLVNNSDNIHDNNNNKHLCICPQGYYGSRCELRMNLTFASFNIGTNQSFIRYHLAYNIKEFFEIRFRFIAQPLEQRNSLLMFMTHSIDTNSTGNDFLSLIYSNKLLYLKLNKGNNHIQTLKSSIELNITEQMVLFGRYNHLFWLLVLPSNMNNYNTNNKLLPKVGHTNDTNVNNLLINQLEKSKNFKQSNTINPYLYVGGHNDWKSSPMLNNLTGFKGCIYDIEIRISRQSDFVRIDENLIDNLAYIDQCDLECT